MTPQGIGMGLEGLYSAISGLQTSSLWLDVIGNNISNVNTVGFKASRTEFSNSLSQTFLSGESDNPSEGLGGTNPAQVGLGTETASIDTLFTQGSLLTTGQNLDVAIQGNGFFVAKQDNQTYLTRAGDLSLDSQGNLVDANGGLIQGFNSSIQYTRQIINTVSSVPGQPAVITYVNLGLNTSNPSDITNININPSMTIPPKATTEINFQGNLDSFQQPNILNLDPPAGAALPIGYVIPQVLAMFPPLNNVIDTNRMIIQPVAGGGFTLQQVANLSTFTPGAFPPPEPLENGFMNLTAVKAAAASKNYAWAQQPPVPPAAQVSETVYDSLGDPRQVTVLFYQVNSLTQNAPMGPSQACYAWYAFDTTGDVPPSTANLVGGTGILEGDFFNGLNPFVGYDRNIPGNTYGGDFIWFNTDGSLASSGGQGGAPGPAGLNVNFMTMPEVYLPSTNKNPPPSPIPDQGAQTLAISLNFGDYGLLGVGERNGLFSDAEGSYQTVNGVNTYVPLNTAHASSQNGYADGTLENLSVDKTGTIQGTFTNGQTVGLAQISMATVANPEGLDSVGNDDYSASASSGSMQEGTAGTNGLGLIQGGALEESNVDLTVELSNMILAQRSYEANARMIAAVNSTLQTLVALGQGA